MPEDRTKKPTFKAPFNFIHGAEGRSTKLVEVRVGPNYDPVRCLLMDQAGGGQPFRTQYDIALDGTEYVLAGGRGRGSYELRILEGPFTDCAAAGIQAMTIHQRYKSDMINKLDDRKIQVVTGVDIKNTSESWMFTGLVDNIATAAHIGEDGYRYILNIITATGMWT